MRYSARPRAPQRHTTTGCHAPISRYRDVAPAPERPAADRESARFGLPNTRAVCRTMGPGDPPHPSISSSSSSAILTYSSTKRFRARGDPGF